MYMEITVSSSEMQSNAMQRHTIGVNFINVFHARFSYERSFGSFLLVTFGLVPKFGTKKCAKNVDEVDGRGLVSNVNTRVATNVATEA